MTAPATTARLDPTTGLTCLACKLVFSSGQLQRDHYRSEWHLYNMKRQIANLPPVMECDFLEKLQHFSQHKQTDDGIDNHLPSSTAVSAPSSAVPPSDALSSLICAVCRNKRFRSRNAFDNHLQSRRHKEEAEEAAAVSSANGADGCQTAASEEDVGKDDSFIDLPSKLEQDNENDGEDEAKEDIARKEGIEKKEGIPPNECLFCEHASDNWEQNLEHMVMQHGFLIPDLPFCADVPALLVYLGFKIGVGLTCIRCQCARFRSLDALRKHMRDANHCCFRIDSQQEGDVLLEFMDFYDYTDQCEDDADNEGEDGAAEDQRAQQVAAVLYDEGAFLVLPSGARIGHRSLLRYFRQHLGALSRAGGGDWHFQGQRAIVKKSSNLLKQLGGGGSASGSCCPLPVLEASVKARARDVSFMKRTVERYRLRQQLASNKLFRSRGRDDQQ